MLHEVRQLQALQLLLEDVLSDRHGRLLDRLSSLGVSYADKSGRRQFQVQHILPAHQHQGARFRQLPAPGLDQMGDVLAAEGLERQRIGQGPDHRRLAVDVGQRHDLAHMRERIAAPLEEPAW